jgi:hypothetical protein
MDTSAHFPDGLPGEKVLGYDRSQGLTDYCFEFQVNKTTEDGAESFAAFTPYRSIVWTGTTASSAVAGMLHGLADLARNGSLNPSNPHAAGDAPIQHAIHVLTERLAWQVDRRKEALGDVGPDEPISESVNHDKALGRVSRDNEIISALATAISALARVKDL